MSRVRAWLTAAFGPTAGKCWHVRHVRSRSRLWEEKLWGGRGNRLQGPHLHPHSLRQLTSLAAVGVTFIKVLVCLNCLAPACSHCTCSLFLAFVLLTGISIYQI